MSQDIKELRVGLNDNSKRIMYMAKELLNNCTTVDLIAGTVSANNASRAAEALKRLNYVTYSNIKIETIVFDDSRKIRFVMTLTKTDDFKKLYDENEATRLKKQEERKAIENTPAKI